MSGLNPDQPQWLFQPADLLRTPSTTHDRLALALPAQLATLAAATNQAAKLLAIHFHNKENLESVRHAAGVAAIYIQRFYMRACMQDFKHMVRGPSSFLAWLSGLQAPLGLQRLVPGRKKSWQAELTSPELLSLAPSLAAARAGDRMGGPVPRAQGRRARLAARDGRPPADPARVDRKGPRRARRVQAAVRGPAGRRPARVPALPELDPAPRGGPDGVAHVRLCRRDAVPGVPARLAQEPGKRLGGGPRRVPPVGGPRHGPRLGRVRPPRPAACSSLMRTPQLTRPQPSSPALPQARDAAGRPPAAGCHRERRLRRPRHRPLALPDAVRGDARDARRVGAQLQLPAGRRARQGRRRGCVLARAPLPMQPLANA